ncbi:hypothetical protein BKA64DRAFT_767200 [Cadophora sp. MPI-SDFR-AT-0126]|nr:hypothetical protein BKA64DRAFT_767200 [Leotiomycetes sp. MPI-SDFR-AT-0126]
MATKTIEVSAAARRKTALAFIESFSTLSATDMLSVRTPSCMHTFAPRSLGILAHSPMSNEQFAAHRSHFDGVLSSFPFQVKEMIDNPSANQVLIWTTASPVWVAAVTSDIDKDTDWSYTGEYMFLLTFEDGESGEDEGGRFKRIERIVEFLDSKGTDRLRRLMQTASNNLRAMKERNQNAQAAGPSSES